MGLFVGVAAALWSINYETEQFHTRALQGLIAEHRQEAERLAGYIEATLTERRLARPQDLKEREWLQDLWSRYASFPKDEGFAAIVDRSGIILKHTSPQLEGDQISWHYYDRRLEIDPIGSVRNSFAVETGAKPLTGGMVVYDLITPLRVNSEDAGELHYGVLKSRVDRQIDQATKRGERWWLAFLVLLLLAAGWAVCGLAVIGRRLGQLDDTLSQVEQRRDGDLRRLSTVLSHRLRNPLHALRLNLHIFKRMGDMPADDVNGLVGEASLQIDRVDRMLQELSEYAELEQPKNETFDAREVVEAVTALLRREAAKKRVEISLISPDRPALVHMDPSRLRQILLCLINNAYDAVAEGGKIDVQVSATKRCVGIIVADDGPGIPKSLQSRLFEPFFTTKENGCGTGLALLKRHVAQANGYVDFEPVEPHGSRFRVVFPAYQAAAGQA